MAKLLFSFFLFVLLIACRKSKCEGDCIEIQISGKVIDSANDNGLANLPVEVYWERRGFCISCSKKIIKSARTDSQGNFNLNVTIDKGKFKDYLLNIEAKCPQGYMGYYPIDNVVNKYITQYNSRGDNLRMVMYRRSDLTIKLRNTQNDNFAYFTLHYSYNHTRHGLIDLKAPPLKDTIFQVQTAGNIYTKIEWRKNYSPGQNVFFEDSIKCSPNGNNIFTLNY